MCTRASILLHLLCPHAPSQGSLQAQWVVLLATHTLKRKVKLWWIAGVKPYMKIELHPDRDPIHVAPLQQT